MDNLKPDLLISINVIGSKEFQLNFAKRTAYIRVYKNLEFPIEIYTKPRRVENILVYLTKRITIPLRLKTAVLVIVKKPIILPTDRDILFEPLEAIKGYELYAYIVDT